MRCGWRRSDGKSWHSGSSWCRWSIHSNGNLRDVLIKCSIWCEWDIGRGEVEKGFHLTNDLGEFKVSKYLLGYPHTGFDGGGRYVNLGRRLLRRLHGFLLLLVDFGGKLAIAQGIDTMPFLLPFVERTSNFQDSSPGKKFLVTLRYEFE